MNAKILTLLANSSAEEVCRNIAYEIDKFEGKYYSYKIENNSEDFCILFTNKFLKDKDAKVLYQALDTTRQYERDRDFLNDEKKYHLDNIYEYILILIEKNQIFKLEKQIKLMNELLYHYSQSA